MRVTIPMSVQVLAELDRERVLMGEASLDATIARRVEAGVAAMGVALDFVMDWRDPSRDGVQVVVTIPDGLKFALEEVGEHTSQSLDAVLVTFASSRHCKPSELSYADALASWSAPNKLERYAYTDDDHGPVYLTTVKMPGYWIEFFNLVGDRRLSLDSVLQLAIEALAREISDTRQVIGIPAGRETLSLARRIAAHGQHA